VNRRSHIYREKQSRQYAKFRTVLTVVSTSSFFDPNWTAWCLNKKLEKRRTVFLLHFWVFELTNHGTTVFKSLSEHEQKRFQDLTRKVH